MGIGYVIRLIPNRYEEEYIDRRIARAAVSSADCRFANIRRIHTRRRNNLAITQCALRSFCVAARRLKWM